jgi:hypothetical protein
MKYLVALLIAVMVGSSVAAPPSAAREPSGLRLYFPLLTLKPDEQIASFEVHISCGHVHSVVGVPDDWNVEVVRRISGVEEIRASAGHGASYKRSMKSFDDVFRVISLDKQCFSVDSDITATFDVDRVIHLSRRELKLLP